MLLLEITIEDQNNDKWLF